MPNEFESLTRKELIALLKKSEQAGVRINFSGKDRAKRLARLVRPRTVRTVQKFSAGEAEHQAQNLLIEGENLQAMSTLYRERGQVDLILTDPPYNTGRDFRYNDKWEEDPNDPGIGEWVEEDDGARHTKWMRFMWPRLEMMYSMLKPTGILAICIDHRELFRLGQMLDELFQQDKHQNRLAIINWQKTAARRSAKTHVSSATEYVLVYAKDAKRAVTQRPDRTDSMNSRYGNPDGDLKGDWREGNLTAPDYSKSGHYGIQSPFNGEVFYPAGNGHWRFSRASIRNWIEDWGVEYEDRSLDDGHGLGLMVVGGTSTEIPHTAREAALKLLSEGPWPMVWFGRDGGGRPRTKTHLEDLKRGVVPITFWANEDYSLPIDLGSTSWEYSESGRSSDGLAELTAIVGTGHDFETVKPIKLFSKVIQLWCPPGGLVLDPFAGSGTTGHAVLHLNQEVAASRRFILIEQGRPDKGDSYARGLTADRLQRVVSGDWVGGRVDPLDGGYRFASLGQKVDAETLLKMERDEMADAVIASHLDGQMGRGGRLISIDDDQYRYLVARNGDEEGFFLVWSGPDENTDFTEAVYEACSGEAKTAGLRPVFHVYARLYLYQTENVRFYQIPDQILSDFGLDIRSEAFAEKDGV